MRSFRHRLALYCVVSVTGLLITGPAVRAANIILDSELSAIRGGKLTVYSDCVPGTSSSCPGTFHDCTASGQGNRPCIRCSGTPVDSNCGTAYAHTTPVTTNCANGTKPCSNAVGAVIRSCESGACTGIGAGTAVSCTSATQPKCTPPK